MYLRETRRTNRDGSVVSYLQLAHNERHPETGSPVAKVIHNFGRAEKVDRAALARLVASISRFLTPEQAAAAAGGADVEIVDSRRLGGAWTLDRVWEQLGIGAAIRTAATGRRLDGPAVERVIFALVAQRALEPGSKLAGTKWVAERVAIEGLSAFTDDQAYRAMDFLLDALDDIASEVFGSVAHLLNLDLDIVFVDTTSTYFEFDVPDELAQLQDKLDDDGVNRPAEQGKRAFGHSKDFRTDLPQVVIAMAVTRDGVPVRCWTFPGNSADTSIIADRQGRPGRLEPAPDGLGRRPRVRLRRQPGLPDPRWRALHPRCRRSRNSPPGPSCNSLVVRGDVLPDPGWAG